LPDAQDGLLMSTFHPVVFSLENPHAVRSQARRRVGVSIQLGSLPSALQTSPPAAADMLMRSQPVSRNFRDLFRQSGRKARRFDFVLPLEHPPAITFHY